MATIEEVRAAFPALHMCSDDMLMSPHFHLGIIQGYLSEQPDKLNLSLDIIADELSGPGCDCGVCP